MQIAEPAVKLRPDLKVIFISGYPQEIRETGSPITRKAPILENRSIWMCCRKRFRNCWPESRRYQSPT
ncbi:hypothetical protein EMIT0215P_30469 [Pseudomonas serboccidentalis]